MDWLVQWFIFSVFNVLGIDICYSVIFDYLGVGGFFFDVVSGQMFLLGIGLCNEVYICEVMLLFIDVGWWVLEGSGLVLEDIIYVVMVLCMGFFVFGFDYLVVWVLGLFVMIQCFYVGFMGCYVVFLVLWMVWVFCDVDL